MIKRKFLVLLLVISMIMSQTEVQGAETEKEHVPATYVQADENGFEIQDGVLVGYTGTDTEVVIPENVTSIGEEAFARSGLTEVTIPASVESIGDYAFNKCTNLVEITLEKGVKSIGYASFANCIELKEIVLPESVTSIGGRAFNYCEFLRKVTLPENVESIGEWAFGWCTNLKEITLPNSVKNIGDYAFTECQITELTFSNNMESIGERAFQNCSDLTKITIENGVKSIGEFAFFGCSGLTEITIPASVESIGKGLVYACSALESIHVETGNKMYSSGNGCNAIIETGTKKLLIGCKNTSIPSDVKSIGNYAFARCDGLTEMTIPEGVESIGERAFTKCGSLTEVKLPESVESIGMEAFYECKSLTKVRIPKKVTMIEKGTFDTCIALTEVKIPGSVTSIENYAFRFCNGLTEVIIPGSATNIGVSAFQACKGLTKVEIRNGVERIDNYAFDACSALTEIALPESVKSIGYEAFGNCKDLTVYGVEGSYAQSYAKRYEFPFKQISEWEDIFEPVDIAICQIHLSQTSYTYDGTEKEPTVTVNDGEKILVSGTDYTVTYTNNKAVGTATVTITGMGDYIGTAIKTFEIKEAEAEQPMKKAITDCEITISPLSYTYDGTEKEPVVTVKDEEKMLVPGTDYTVTYTNNKAVGTATVTITGMGDYTGTATRTFEIKNGISTPTPVPEQSPTPGLEQSPTPVPTQTPDISRQIPKKGETVTDAKTKAAYVVTNVSGKNASVTYTSSTVKNARNIIVPAKVTVQGQEYKVTAIARDAFKNNKKLAGAVIGKNVVSIGDRAFYRCTALKKITIPSKVSKIGKKAFYGCKKLKNIHVKTGKLTKKSVGSQAFKKIHGKAMVKVPKNKRAAYKKLLRVRGVTGKRKIK